MIPQFPDIKKLELSDKEDILRFTEQFPPYSDFDFASIWSWDVKEEMGVAVLNDNLVIRFTDYTRGTPLLSFLGTKEVNDTARTLIEHSPDGELGLIPEVTVVGLDPTAFSIEEDRDQFDYVCDVRKHIAYPGRELKAHRTLLRQFFDANPTYERVSLDLSLPETQNEVAAIYKRWDENKGFLTISESFAYERFLDSAANLAYSAVGIRLDGVLIAFHVVSLPPGTCADALFSKADTSYRGVYAALDHVVALDLLDRNYTYMNIQQDLGIENLRKAKLSLSPAYFLKKYRVRLLS